MVGLQLNLANICKILLLPCTYSQWQKNRTTSSMHYLKMGNAKEKVA